MASSDLHHGRIVFYGAVVSPVSLTLHSTLPHCLLSIASGKIEWRIDNIPRHKIQEILERRGLVGVDVVYLKDREFLVPGFIDTHTHAPQFPIMGTGNQYKLLDWLNTLVFPTESEFKDENVEFVQKTYESVVRRILNLGTTTCCYYGSYHLEATKTLADIAYAFGQRAFIGKCNMDSKSPDDYEYIESSADESIENTHKLISHIRGLGRNSITPGQEPLVQPVLTPRFALSCSRELFKRLGSLADSDPTLRIQTHISENETEVSATLKKFPEARSYAAVYSIYGLLRENTILAHAVHLTKEEVELIKEKGAGISHCPTSNFNLNSGIAPVGYFLDRGVKVGLGTDVSGGYSPSILNAIQNASIAAKALSFKKGGRPSHCHGQDHHRPDHPQHGHNHDHRSDHPQHDHKHDHHRPDHPQHDHDHDHQHGHDHQHDHHHDQFTNSPFSISTLLYLATAGGAAVCGIENQVGSLSAGKDFDALLVNVGESSTNPGLWGLDDSATPHHVAVTAITAEPEIGLEDRKKKELEEEKAIVDRWLERFLHGGDDRNIERVYVRGRLVGGQSFRVSDAST